MVNNPHRAVVLKMSKSTALNLKMLLKNFALKYIGIFEGKDSCYYTECLAFYNTLEIALQSYEGDKQLVIDVKLPAR